MSSVRKRVAQYYYANGLYRGQNSYPLMYPLLLCSHLVLVLTRNFSIIFMIMIIHVALMKCEGL